MSDPTPSTESSGIVSNLSNNVPSNHGYLVPSTMDHGEDDGNGMSVSGSDDRVTALALPEWPEGLTASQERFLTAYALGGSISAAARACEISRANPYRWRESSEIFEQALAIAKEYGVQHLEDWALARAMDTMNPSDRLTEFLLKAARPEVYRERVDHRLTGQIEHRKRVILETLDVPVVEPEEDE